MGPASKPFKPAQYQWSCSMGRPKRPLTRRDTDLVAFVALDVRCCIFVPVDAIDQQVTFKKPAGDLYIPTIEADTLAECASHFS